MMVAAAALVFLVFLVFLAFLACVAVLGCNAADAAADAAADQTLVETFVETTPPLPNAPWVSNKKWVAYFYGVYRAHAFGAARPPWPNPGDRLLSNTQKAALDPVHASKLRRVQAIERRCAAPGARCVASETAARIAAIWAERYSATAVREMYAAPDAYLLRASLPDV